MARILVWYRVGNGPIMQGYAERTCSGDVIFDSVDSVTPIEGAAAIPAPALPAETRIAPTAYDCYGQPTIRVHDTCAIEILRKIEAGLQSAPSDTALLEGAKVFTGTGNTGVIPNGNTSVFTVALADGASSVLATTSGAALGITNGGAFPTNVFLDSIVLTADNTAQLTVRNESGVEVPAFNVGVKAIDYTAAAAAAATAAKRVEYGRVTDPTAPEVQVTFAVPFSAAPFITITAVCGDDWNYADTVIAQVTNTGFILRRGSFFSTGVLVDVEWKAEEK